MYQKDAAEALQNQQHFWDRVARETLTWFKPWTTVSSGDFSDGQIKWFEGAKLNACYNCVDRHLETRGDKVALIGEANEPGQSRSLTYTELHHNVICFANLLKHKGFKKGDRVAIYMPMTIEAVVAMLACARLGIIHSVVFGGFSAEALRSRVVDAECAGVITVESSMRGQAKLNFKQNVDEAVKGLDCVRHVMIMRPGQKFDSTLEVDCPCVEMDSEDPLFILYTSGSTGKPKGVLHTTGGYLTYAAYTHKLVFDLKEDDVYFCTADIGWITGHSYIVYGPLANGTTTVVFEGAPLYPTPERYWQMVDQHQISIFYTAPTAIRLLMQQGDAYLKSTKRDSLRVLGSVGEPINPEAWEWYFHQIGKGNCPVMDTWWQTETGGILMAPMVPKEQQKPGAAMKALPGIEFCITPAEAEAQNTQARLDSQVKSEDKKSVEGALLIAKSWPGVMRTVYGDHQRFLDVYLKPNPGYYTTGDAAKIDEEGDYWILGRMDDVLNVAGHRIGTAEVESALVLHDKVAEAAVVGIPHVVKGEGICAFVSLMKGETGDQQLRDELVALVRKEIGPIAAIDCLLFVIDLPKTRSGKIMRRILRKIAHGEEGTIGDTSTLANPESVELIVRSFQEIINH